MKETYAIEIVSNAKKYFWKKDKQYKYPAVVEWTVAYPKIALTK